MSSFLLIFTKNPQLGHVKTRLARTLGEAEALRIYLQLLELTRQAALGISVQRWLYYSKEVVQEDDWPNDKFVKKAQSGDGLGERMQHAFQEGF